MTPIEKEYVEKMKEYIEYLEKGFIRRDDQREFRAEITALKKQVEEQESKQLMMADQIEAIFKNVQRIHGKSDSLDWIRIASIRVMRKSKEYAQSRLKDIMPTESEMRREVIPKYKNWDWGDDSNLISVKESKLIILCFNWFKSEIEKRISL